MQLSRCVAVNTEHVRSTCAVATKPLLVDDCRGLYHNPTLGIIMANYATPNDPGNIQGRQRALNTAHAVSQDSWNSPPLSKSTSTGTALGWTVLWLISSANELMIPVVAC